MELIILDENSSFSDWANKWKTRKIIGISKAYQTAVNSQVNYLTNFFGDISINRIKQIAGEDFPKIVNNIIVFEPTSFLEQNENLKTIELWIRKHHDDVDLCVLDSAVALYRVDDMKSSRLNKELGKQMGILAKIARNYDVAVVLTNQIYSSFDDDNKDVVKAVGGTILQYWSKTIIQLERNDEFNKRVATLKRHRSMGEGKQATFKIVERGII